MSRELSAARLTASGGTTARTIPAKLGEVLSVKDFGAVGDGTTDDTAAVQAAWTAAMASPKPRLWFPAGTYRLATLSASLVPVSGAEVYGDGANATTIKFDTADGVSLFYRASGTRATDITFRDLHVEGGHAAGSYIQRSSYPFLLSSVDGVTLSRVKITKSRTMAAAFRDCTAVDVRSCIARYCARDGFNAADCSSVSMVGNRIEFCDDDAIAIHTQVYGTNDRGHVVTGNIIRFGQGIKLLGAKTATISCNTLEFIMGQGITVESTDTGLEGINASSGVAITGNVIKNCIDRAIVDGANSTCPYIVIGGPAGKAGGLAAIPGENDTTTGTVVSLYPYFENSKSSSTAAPIPHNYNVIVSDNVCVRDIAASGLLSALGFGTFYTRNGPVDPTLTESAVRQYGVVVRGGVLKNAVIRGNTFMGLAGGLYLSANTSRLVNSLFQGNTVFDCTYGFVATGTNTLHQGLAITENVFDIDPLLTSSNRAVGGGWTADGNPTALLIQNSFGYIVARNVFRNTCRIIDQNINSDTNQQSAKFYVADNIVEADPSAVGGFSTSNKGVGNTPRGGLGFTYRILDCTPTSATYGNVLNHCPVAMLAIPTTGKFVQGHVVRNANPAIAGTAGSRYVVSGWLRITTGSAHVSGTDWAEMRTLTGT